MAIKAGERPVASFVLSLIGGLLVLVGGAMVAGLSSGLPYYGGMMGGRYYGGMAGGYYGMMRGFGLGGGWFYGLAAIGVVSGIIILLGSVMVYNHPSKSQTWGAVVVALSIASLFSTGGFFVGSILGLLGGISAIVWKPGV